MRPTGAWAAHPFVQTVVLYAKLHKIVETPSPSPAVSPVRRLLNSPVAPKSPPPSETPQLFESPQLPLPPPRIVATRQLVPCADGGTIALDWLSLEGATPRAGAPVLIGFPGLGNCSSHHGFLPMLIGALIEAGDVSAAAVVVYPGFAGHALDSYKLPGTCYLSTRDAGAALSAARAAHPSAPLLACGCSFGSAVVANWASRHPDEARALGLRALLLYAYGHSAGSTTCSADAYANGIVGVYVAQKWQTNVLHARANALALAALARPASASGGRNELGGHGAVCLRALREARSVAAWDEACMPAYGFRSRVEFLLASDPVHTFARLDAVCPVVIFNADDDWLCPAARLQAARAALYDRMANVLLIVTRGGGHLGWIDTLPSAAGERAKGGPSRTGEHSDWLVRVTRQLVEAGAMGTLQAAVDASRLQSLPTAERGEPKACGAPSDDRSRNSPS